LCRRALAAVVVIVIVAPPETVANEQLASDGKPEQVNVTVWAKPPCGVRASVVFPLCPGTLIVTLVGFAARLKSWTSNGIEEAFEVTNDPLGL
jgi:hypothetical protein